MDVNKPLETAHYAMMRQLQECPEQTRVYQGEFARIKNDLMRNHLIEYKSGLKYGLTDLGREKLAEHG